MKYCVSQKSIQDLKRPMTVRYRYSYRVLNSYRLRSQPRAPFSGTRRSLEKPYYITTPIFYVNSAPHVGHLYTMVIADILKRWQVLKGKQAVLCTGTDEHGIKIQRAAEEAQMPVKEFCDLNSRTFQALAKRAAISNNHFVRTTDADHKDAVEFFWALLEQENFIYESKHEGWYCVSDETFYPNSTIEKRIDPRTGKLFFAAQETGKEVEWTSERNYHFRLSALQEKLLAFYEENPEFVVPAERMESLIKEVSSGLEDLSISRPVERLRWGIRVPDDEGQTIYVWLDALINYITKAKFPWAPEQESIGGWPADVQVIGKDIVRFHCIYWPAFLLAAGLQPPKQVLTHAHWTLGKQKMAKSTGNVVNPFFALDRFGVDLMRFYLAHDGGILNDSDYANRHIVARYKKCLQGGLGNLLNRLVSSKSWNLKSHVQAAKEGNLGIASSEKTKEQIKILQELPEKVAEKMKLLNPRLALLEILNSIFMTNTYLQACAPWRLIDSQHTVKKIERSSSQVTDALYYSIETVRIAGILLQPYMPGKASELLSMIGVHAERRTFEFAKLGADFDYCQEIVPVRQLFPPLPVED